MTSVVKLAAVLILVSLFRNGNSANILGLMGCVSHSHHLWNEVIVNTLAERGHTLTLVSVDTDESPNDNLTYIHLEGTYNVVNEHFKDLFPTLRKPMSLLSNIWFLYDFQMVTCKGIVQSKGFQEALNLEEDFDLILYDIANGPCLLRLAQKYPDVPIVAVSAFKITPEILDIVGGHSYPAYVPLFLNQLDVPMNLWHRLYNTGTYAIAYFYRKYVSDVIVDSIVGKHFPIPKPSLEDLYQRIQVVLTNTHPSTDVAQSLPPSIIEVGGLHIQESKPLPLDLKEFIEGGERGAVLISIGSNTQAEVLGEERLKAFINVISKFPKFNFLWKVERPELIKTIPKNLLIRKWLPQNDIMAHPNIKAFFCHAGGLSMQEAAWYGVPVVVMPFYLDQISNAHRAQAIGYGRVVDFETLTEKSLFQGLSEVLTDETYRNNMLKIQTQFRGRQNPPLDTAIWWIEYILKNPRVDHLIENSRHMSYFVANSLDIVFICFMLVVAFMINLWIVLRNIRVSLSKAKPKEKSTIKVKSSSKKKEKIKKN